MATSAPAPPHAGARPDTLLLAVALVALAVVTGGVLEFQVGERTVGINTAQAVTLAIAVMGGVHARQRGTVRVDLLAIPVVAMMGLTLLQGVVVGTGPLTTGGLGRFATVLLLLLALPQFTTAPVPPAADRGRANWDVPIVLMGVAIAVMALLKVAPAMGDPDLGFYDLKDVVQLPLGNHNYVAAIIVAALAVVLVRPLGRTWWTAAAGVIGLGLVVTLSRGAWLAAGVVLVLLVVTRRNRATFFTLAGVAAAGLALLVVVLLAGGGATDRLAGVFTPATAARLNLWGASWDAFAAHPVLGVGVDRLPEWMTSVREPYVHAHNLVLHALSTTGVLGAAIYLAYWAGAGLRVLSLPDMSSRLRVGLPLLALFVHAQIASLSYFLVYEVVVATLIGVAATHPTARFVHEVGWGGRGAGATEPRQ